MLGVPLLGALFHGAPHLGLHGLSWSALSAVAPIAGVVALVIVSQTAATTRAFADQGTYEVDVNRDFLGVGAGSIVAGLVGAFPVDASPPRTAAVVSASGRTQVAGLAAGALVLLIPAVALLEDLPLATLAAVLIFIATRICTSTISSTSPATTASSSDWLSSPCSRSHSSASSRASPSRLR